MTELRKNPFYAIYYNNWTRLIVLGIIPAAMLIYFNYKVNEASQQLGTLQKGVSFCGENCDMTASKKNHNMHNVHCIAHALSKALHYYLHVS